MKSKITRIKPAEVGNMKYKEVKMILKKDVDVLLTLGEEGTTFFIQTDFDYSDKKKTPLLIVGDFKGDWKKHTQDSVKPPHKTTCSGRCILSEDGKKLTFNIVKGKAKPTIIKNLLKKSKLLPTTITKVLFNQVTVVSTEDGADLDAMDNAKKDRKDKLFSKVIEGVKVYKTILSSDLDARKTKIKELIQLVDDWQKENSEDLEVAKVAAKNDKLVELKNDLLNQIQSMKVAERTKIANIEPIVNEWEAFLKRPGKNPGMELLPEWEDRIDILSDLKEEIAAWNQNNPGPLSPDEKKNKTKLDQISKELEIRLASLQHKIPNARKAHTRFILEKLSNATDKEKKELAQDSDFLVEMARSIPVAHINKARQLLGLDPVKIETGDDQAPVKGGEEWNDPEVLKAFEKFEKVVTFSEDIKYRNDPKIESFTVTFPSGAQVYDTSFKESYPLAEEMTFSLISESKKGRMKLVANNVTYYASRKDMLSITHFEKQNVPLFNGTPNKNDVKQGGLGDCYLLAAVISLVNKDPKAIEDMMLDKGDTVTVRLFHVAYKKGKKTFTPRYFNINKSIVVDSHGNDQYAIGSLWVQLLEKAYAAGNFTGAFWDYKGRLKKDGKYTDIDGGFASFAMEVLIGREAKLIVYHADHPENFVITGVENADRGNPDGPKKASINSPWGTLERTNFKKAKSPKAYQKLTTYEIMGQDLEKTKKWFQFVSKKSISTLFKREYTGSYSGIITLEDLELLFKGKMKDASDNEIAGLPVLDAEVAKLMLDWIKKQKLYPGKRGSGIYSALQLNLFNQVKTALDNNDMVSVGSKAMVGRTIDALGHSGGEGMSGGLVGSHAYPILEHKESDPNKELLMRNPWGQHVQKNLTVKERIAELVPNLKKLCIAEIKALKSSIESIAQWIKEDKEALKNAKTEEEKKDWQESIKALTEDAKTMKVTYDALIATKDFEAWKDKLSGDRLEGYNKLLLDIQNLRKKDPDALISKAEDSSSDFYTWLFNQAEHGEFWMLLDDLTHRFDQVYIG